MVSFICLIWVGLKLQAPTWYFVLLIFGFVIRLLDIGIKLGKNGKGE